MDVQSFRGAVVVQIQTSPNAAGRVSDVTGCANSAVSVMTRVCGPVEKKKKVSAEVCGVDSLAHHQHHQHDGRSRISFHLSYPELAVDAALFHSV